MRILHCIHHLQGGGAERQLQLLANASPAHGMTAGIVCVNADGREAFSQQVSVFVARRKSHYDPRFILDIARAIGRFRPDLVHVWLPEIMTVPSLTLAMLRRIPSVFSYRWAMHWHRPLALLEFATALMASRSIISNHALSTDSSPYHWLFAQKQGVVIPNGVPFHGIRSSGTGEGVATTTTRILFAGRLTQQKNWSCLIDALALLRTRKNWQLVVCGAGEDRDALIARAQALGIDSRVELRGYVNNLSEVMAQSQVLVLPSWNEGMSNVMFEAYANGLPCLASDIPQNREIVDRFHCALLFDPHSPQSLARELDRVLDDPALANRLGAAGQRVAQEYSVDAMVSRHAALYRQLLGEGLPADRQQAA
ncbi:MAG: glycosyltransferase [Nitrospiraceae bacterium]